MNRVLTILVLVSAFSLHARSQTSNGPAQPHSTPAKQTAQTKTLSIAELHEVARSVSVEITERTEVAPGFRHLGSGVWLAEGIVATCWHVVNGVRGPIKVSLGTGGVNHVGNMVLSGIFRDYATTVVASDPDADIAILKTEQNPFTDTGSIIKTPTESIKPNLGVARVNQDVPVAGTLTVLSGYPLNGSDLVSQTGNVAGTGVPRALGDALKGVRILVSLVSNPGNSGGPVLDDRGQLIGLLEGNLTSPMKDPMTQAPVIYFRPKMNADGTLVKDANGIVQPEIAQMFQNSGISIVIPSRLITPLLKQAEEAK